MAINGMGIVTVPAAMVMREIATGTLVRVPYDWTPEALQFFARYDAQKAMGFVETAADLARQVAASFEDQSKT